MKKSGLSLIFINKIIKGANKNWAQFENKVPSMYFKNWNNKKSVNYKSWYANMIFNNKTIF